MSSTDLHHTIEGLNISPEEKALLLAKIAENNKKLMEALWRSARASLLARNFSHTMGDGIASWTHHTLTPEYRSFLDILSPWVQTTREIFEQDCLKLCEMPIYQSYRTLREKYSVTESLQDIDWRSFLAEPTEASMPTREVAFAQSRVWSLWQCAGRINTVLGMLYVSEWPKYIEENVQFVDIVWDAMMMATTGIPVHERDLNWLRERLMYEDPHGCLIVEWTQIDPTMLHLKQILELPTIAPHVVSRWLNSPHATAYDLLYLMWLNTVLTAEQKQQNQWWYRSLLGTFEKIFWPTHFVARLKCEMDPSREYIDLITQQYPTLANYFWLVFAWYQNDPQKLATWVTKVYGSQFTTEDVMQIFW